MSNTQCDVCFIEVPRAYRAADGSVCPGCYEKAGFHARTVLSKYTIEMIGKEISSRSGSKDMVKSYRETRRYGGLLSVDDNLKAWFFDDPSRGIKKKIRSFNALQSADIVQEEETVSESLLRSKEVFGYKSMTTQNTQIVNRLGVRIFVKDTAEPLCYYAISAPTDITSPAFSSSYPKMKDQMQDVVRGVDYILQQQDIGVARAPSVSSSPQPVAPEGTLDTADQIRKFKSLLDDGIITQDEFDAKKKQLLGL